MYKNASEAFRKFYSHKIILTNYTLAQMLVSYVGLSNKVRRNDECALESLKTNWIIFEREMVNEEFPLKI